MGCDIHIVQEFKYKGKWLGARLLHGNRDYSFFAILCGVRKYYETYENWKSIAEGRGVPEDASELSKALSEDWGSDLHSATYATPSEIIQAVEFLKAQFPDLPYLQQDNGKLYKDFIGVYYPKEVSGLVSFEGEHHNPDEEIRYVIWFDN